MAEHWIADATKNRGALHRQLGVPADKPISEGKIESKLSDLRGKQDKSPADVTEERRLNLANTLRGFHKPSVQEIASQRLKKMRGES